MTPYYADDAVTLHHGDCLDVMAALPDASVDAVVTDPPYGLGFMGREWDGLPPGLPWARQCLRVLKPGGHLLAFGGTRTWHRLAVAVEDAGFEVRDSIAWLYGSGFPKSRDVSDAMGRYLAGHPAPRASPNIRPGVYDVTAYLRKARDKAGWSNRRIDDLFGTNGMAGHWTSLGTQPAVPSLRQWEVLRNALGFGTEMDALVTELAASERPEDWGEGAEDSGTFLGTLKKGADYDGPGPWGTALKPAFEPVVVGRKPVEGTATNNVARYGTGGLNIDGCRTPLSAEDRAKFEKGAAAWAEMSRKRGEAKAAEVYGEYGIVESRPHEGGRWPTNVAVDTGQARTIGEAARVFPIFRYEAKAPTAERPRHGEVAHPTVKPLDLMRWLVRLVTPPGGTVLEPFAGSGTTAEACVIEGFRCIAIEREAAYLPLIVARLSKPIQPDLFGGAA